MPDMETCSHVWEYDHESFDTVYMRCPYCNLVRIAYPGETVARINRPQKVKEADDER